MTEESTRVEDTIEGVVSDLSNIYVEGEDKPSVARSQNRGLPFVDLKRSKEKSKEQSKEQPKEQPNDSTKSQVIGNLGNPDFIHVIQLNHIKKRLILGETAGPIPQLVDTSDRTIQLVDTSDRIRFGIVPNLTDEFVHEMIRDVLIMILNYVGYESASNNALQTLVHVCHSFLTQTCRVFRNSFDNQGLKVSMRKDPSHLIFDTFEEIGFSVPKLHEYYLSIGRRKRRLIHELASKYQVVIQDPRSACQAIDGQESNPKKFMTFLQPLDLSHGFSELEEKVEEEKTTIFWDKNYEEYDLLTEKEILEDAERSC